MAQQFIRHNKVKAIIADSWKSIELLAPQHVPVIVLAHGTEYPHHATLRKRARIAQSLTKASAVVANSHYTASLVMPYMQNPDCITVMHPPIPPLPQASADALAAIDAQIAGRSPVIASISRFEPRKGIDSVIRAMPSVLARHPHAVVLVGGFGDDRTRLGKLAPQMGVAETVKFIGRVDAASKAALLTRADVFAMPTRREGNSVEGFGIAYVEAAWYGVPAIAGREGGAVDAVFDGKTGLIVDGANQTEITSALLALLNDDGLRKSLGEAAAARARSELQWPAAIAQYRALMNRH